ncbi:hypothetical protein FS749_003615 [Ceratobasidium sp. UAMH 11750]|nr:hypothetical protein FS749_003615 [Ceratobasidium sp. UAMH 11750]
MLHNATHNTHHTYPPPNLSLSTSEPTRLSSGAGRYEPWLILYPYRRHSMPTIKSATFPQVLDGVGGKGNLDREPVPAPAVHAASSTGTLPTPEASYSSPTPAMATTPSKSLGDTVVDGFCTGDNVAPVGKSIGSRGENSRKYVLKQGLATIGRGLRIKPLRLRERIEKALDSGVFKPRKAKSSVVEIELARLGGGPSPVEVDSFETSVPRFRDANWNMGTWSAASPCKANCFCGSNGAKPENREIDAPFSGTILASRSTSRSRDTLVNINIGHGTERRAVSVPIFEQRPLSGEDNRERVFRRMSALVRAPPMKPLGLKGTGFGSGLSAAKSQATKPNTIEGDLIQSNENPSSVIQSNDVPSNQSDLNDVHFGQVELGPVVAHEPPPTHAELTELFDIVEALYSAMPAPEDPPTLQDDIIADAFVLHGRLVRVSRSAGSRQDALSNVGAKNDRVNSAESQRVAFELPPVKPLRLKSKGKGLTTVPDGTKPNEVEPSTAQGNTSEEGFVEARVCKSAELQSCEAQSGISAPEDVPPVEAKLDALHSNSIADTANVPAPFIVPDLIVTSYEDGAKVAVKTPGRKSRKAGIDRKSLFAYHTFHAPRTKKTTRASSESSPISDPSSVFTSTPEGESSGDMADAFESDEFDYDVDHSDAESDPFEYDHFLSDSSQVQTSVVDPDDSDEDEDDVESDPFKYDFILKLVDAESREPELESSPASSPESTPPMTPTSMDSPLSSPSPLGLTDKSSGPIDLETSWAWNSIDEVDDRDGAIGIAL